MKSIQISIFISMVLFHLTNVISGASLGNVNLFNKTFEDADEHRTVLQQIQKNYKDEFRNYEMADIEKFLSGFMTPVKIEKKPIYTSKTYFGSDKFFDNRERSKDNRYRKTWDPFRANRIIGSQPSYFDVPDDLFQQYVYSKKNSKSSYSKTGNNASDFSDGIENLSENKDKISFSEIAHFRNKKNELFHPKDDEFSEDQFYAVDETKDQIDDLSHSIGDDVNEVNESSRLLDGTEDQEDKLLQLADKDDADERSDKVYNFELVSSTSTEDEVDEISRSVDDGYVVGKSSHQVDETQSLSKELTNLVDEIQDQGEEISHSVVDTQDPVDELFTFERDVLDFKDFHTNEVNTEKMSHSTMTGVEGKFMVFDETENREDVLINSMDSGASESRKDELNSKVDNVDSQFFRLNKLNAVKAIENLMHLNTTNTKNSFDNRRNNVDILPLDEQNENESHFGEIPDKNLHKVQNVTDLREFVEKSFDKASVTIEDLDFHKTDIEEFEGSGDMGNSFDVLANSFLDSKSGRIVDVFFRGDNTAECTTPKGERGHCRSLAQCPLSEPLNNFNLFLKYVCLSRGILVGVCCPDNPVVEISDPSENSTETPVTEFKQPVDGCGLNTNTRIVGGKVSLPHEWTWMVALLRRNRFFCGGVIINDWYILTAAHCVMGIKVKDLKVRLGEYNFSEKNEHQEDISVAEIKRHALFVTLTFQHDIALLKLKRKIVYTKFIGSICLPNPKSGNFSNVNATVVGWGTEAFGGTASPVLRQVTVPVWDNDDCDKTYRLERITNAFMCAGSPENGEDACQGDSGGPLMSLSEENRWEVIGIVSWGRRCGDPTFPGVYTRVTTYLDWITENAN